MYSSINNNSFEKMFSGIDENPVLRPASELRKEHDKGEGKAFKEAWINTVLAINEAHAEDKTSASLLSILRDVSVRDRVISKLEDLGYKVESHSDYRDSYLNVSW